MTTLEPGRPIQLLGTDDVCSLLGVSKSTLYARIKSGAYPPGAKFGHCRKWTSTEHNDHIRAVIDAASNAADAA